MSNETGHLHSLLIAEVNGVSAHADADYRR